MLTFYWSIPLAFGRTFDRSTDVKSVIITLSTKYMLVPSSSRTAVARDMATKVLENERARRLDHCATVIQKNLKATYYRRRYLKARDAILFAQYTIDLTKDVQEEDS
ncbi:hypothetical protein DL98DRAFT_600328 [Cadophora sp. DSE1049]|nr:hypothetical protein DL98DRAFT_600328 [Cadophora sp. DSE1049]